MTGTSLDALDVAVVEIRGERLRMKLGAVERFLSRPLGELQQPLRNLAEQKPTTAGEIAELSRRFAEFHAEAIAAALDGRTPDLIVCHGQTVFHRPPTSWQLFSPAVVAERFRCPVVSDLRSADLAAGGQGAPITPLADWVLFAAAGERRAVVNLGGFANFTLLPRAADGPDADAAVAAVRGGDICACNHVLDEAARRLLKQPFDRGGLNAAKGNSLPVIRDSLLAVMRGQARTGRSLGTGDELARWFESLPAHAAADDVLRSICAAIAAVVVERIGDSDRIVLAGGGARNRTLEAEIRDQAGRAVARSDELGVAAEAREAIAMAVLGALCADRVPITLSAVTGVRNPAPIAGVWAGTP